MADNNVRNTGWLTLGDLYMSGLPVKAISEADKVPATVRGWAAQHLCNGRTQVNVYSLISLR